MSEAGDRVLPPQTPEELGETAQAQGAGADAKPTGMPAAAPRRVVAEPRAMVELAASMVPAPPAAWRRFLAQIRHFWLLVVFVVVWECISVFGVRFNPQLDVMLPPPTAVFSAAMDLIGRGVRSSSSARWCCPVRCPISSPACASAWG